MTPSHSENPPSSRFYRASGALAAMVTMVIWAAWIVSTRHSVTTTLGPVDIGLLRFAVPALFLSPFWLRRGIWPRGLPVVTGLAMICGSGVLFFLIASSGMRYVPASQVGALLPGAMPLWAALLAVVLLREKISMQRMAGYGAILGGIALLVAGLVGGAANGDMWRGYVMFQIAACLWAGYTHAFHRSGLNAFEAAGFIAFWSFAVLAVVALLTGTSLFSVPLADVGLQLVTQGLLSGFVAIICYGIAIRRIGAQASAFAALAPALAAIGGVWVLDEHLSITAMLAVGLIALGVLFATGFGARWRGRANRVGPVAGRPAKS